MAETARPQLVAPRQIETLEMVHAMGGGFDIDAWHVMEARDNALIADEVLHGPGSSTFVYSFDIRGKLVAGISVVGARHLANHYGGLKHRLITGIHKIGRRMTFIAYPQPSERFIGGASDSLVDDDEGESDFYAAVCEIVDIKTGNSIQVERRENRIEFDRDGNPYERPNYPTIAQSKAYRNGVLALIPQPVAIRWKLEMLKLKKEEVITGSVLEEKRSNVLHFATQKAIALDRQKIEGLTLDQIAGLGDAAREGRVPAFVEAAKVLGLEISEVAQQQPKGPAAAARPATRAARTRPRAEGAAAAGTKASGPLGPEPPPPGEPTTEGKKPEATAATATQTTGSPASNEPAKTNAPANAGPRRVNFEM